MAGRIRSLKPELLDDEPTANLSDAAWRLFVSLWVVADDHGNTRLGSKYVAATIWQDTSRDVDGPIDELVAKRFLEPYAKSDQRYAHIRGWEKHQRIDNAGNPRVPTPSQDDGSLPTWFREFRPILALSAASLKAAQVCLGDHKTSPESSPLDHDHDLDHDLDNEPSANATQSAAVAASTQWPTQGSILPSEPILVAAKASPEKAESSTRVKHKFQKTLCPDPADVLAFTTWCAGWKLDPGDPVVVNCATFHYGKGNLWRDWNATVRTWRGNQGGRQQQVQTTPRSGQLWRAEG